MLTPGLHPRERPSRVVVEGVSPEVDGGRFPVKRTLGEQVAVEADVFADGHDVVTALLRYRAEGEPSWTELAMEPRGNDRWRAAFTVTSLGTWRYTVEGFVDAFRTWRAGLAKKVEAGQVEPVDLLVGAELVEAAAGRARGADAARLAEAAGVLRAEGAVEARARAALDEELGLVMARHPDRSGAAALGRELEVCVERERARYGAWYELFPRSATPEPGRHGTLRDVAARLPYVAGMGFDVLYLPPIHPIGRAHRKGRNNAPAAAAGDVGSPWAIGAAEGGHTALHPELGTLDDFRALLAAARAAGVELALDLALQCSPDHPWVREHPEWFRRRPDGSIQYAENPPKKYQDIYPLDFECARWRELWEALLGVVEFWVGEGVRIFRVDNPHTKPFRFWEWLIATARRRTPELVFLAEAFTRPKVMYQLAKLGFSQSYTYFTWRNTRFELTEYLRELTRAPVKEFFRPSFWPNTPDILPEPLQWGGRPMFQARLVLAATLAASYGVYGPVFEQLEARPLAAGREEYLDSEKYQLRPWDPAAGGTLRDFIARVNQIRRENPALHANEGLVFHRVDDEQLLAYSKARPDGSDGILVVVNLDPHHVHAGWVELALEALGVQPGEPFQVHDLLGGGRYSWSGARNYVEIDPRAAPAQIFRIRRRLRTERDFDYFL
ncbi:alpha-1,4-glucan--maltose-1-phosphate maltosyltransferase [Anaeromyxobacter diazotrophicus]|uniref:Alpha-1,4-glucan:maltose-1-phosphate maltosyltransferase n=1 Tax=Anaeromyxobacter diazotrophicus TaxID=2590199 RepID=A0A7I9VGN7_9BACT|nr:alpha-1,4-glucan--maltose-1-phosphate maltosyltransferase [Anaeromyxobacter diazotrophicus]GEJ55409.1 alpha-1,4-glucan:maltose-1-phosphate maltosyltransferase [Anaeromyxobacter diazotrophicus]